MLRRPSVLTCLALAFSLNARGDLQQTPRLVTVDASESAASSLYGLVEIAQRAADMLEPLTHSQSIVLVPTESYATDFTGSSIADQIRIRMNWGALGLLESEDELMFLLLRALAQAKDWKLKSSKLDEAALDLMTSATTYSPLAATLYFDKLQDLLLNVPSERSALAEYAVRRELAKAHVETIASSRTSLAGRLDLVPFTAVNRRTLSLIYLWTWDHYRFLDVGAWPELFARGVASAWDTTKAGATKIWRGKDEVWKEIQVPLAIAGAGTAASWSIYWLVGKYSTYAAAITQPIAHGMASAGHVVSPHLQNVAERVRSGWVPVFAFGRAYWRPAVALSSTAAAIYVLVRALAHNLQSPTIPPDLVAAFESELQDVEATIRAFEAAPTLSAQSEVKYKLKDFLQGAYRRSALHLSPKLHHQILTDFQLTLRSLVHRYVAASSTLNLVSVIKRPYFPGTLINLVNLELVGLYNQASHGDDMLAQDREHLFSNASKHLEHPYLDLEGSEYNLGPALLAAALILDQNAEGVVSEDSFVAVSLLFRVHNKFSKFQKHHDTVDFEKLATEFAALHCSVFVRANRTGILVDLVKGSSAEQTKTITRCMHEQVAVNAEYSQLLRIYDFFLTTGDEKNSASTLDVIKQVADSYTTLAEFAEAITNLQALSEHNAEVLLRKPQLISTFADVELVLQTDGFWTTGDATGPDANSPLLSGLRRAARGYNIEQTEELHGLLLRSMQGVTLTLEEKRRFWENLSKRGTSVYSDEYFWSFYPDLSSREKLTTLSFALTNDRLFDTEVKKRLVRDSLFSDPRVQLMAQGQFPTADREQAISELIHESLHRLGHGIAHAQLLEDLSVTVRSSPEESTTIETAKYGDNSQLVDAGQRFFEVIVKEVLEWNHTQQWDFILMLIGHQDTVSRKTMTFLRSYRVTPRRLRRIFESMPTEYRTILLDAMLGHINGILHDVDLQSESTGQVVEFVLSGVTGAAREVAQDLLAAYLKATSSPLLKPYQSTLFAHLLLATTSGSKSHEMLARVCEHFESFGVKIGQFLLASRMLPSAENSALMQLEDRSRLPKREAMYNDLREIFPGGIPYTIKEIVGGASLKYVVRATPNDRPDQDVVLKVLRKDAIIKTDLNREILRRVIAHLKQAHGNKYDILSTAIEVASAAIARELDLRREAENTEIAQTHIYTHSVGNIDVVVSADRLVNVRVLESTYSQGSSLYSHRPETRKDLTTAILRIEHDNLFGAAEPKPGVEETERTIYFDPDRHPGNFRMRSDALFPLDFGQLHTISARDLDRMITVAAIAGILRRIGENGLTVSRLMSAPVVAHLFQEFVSEGEGEATRVRPTQESVQQTIAMSFSGSSAPANDIAGYYTLLRVLDEARLLPIGEIRMAYFDLAKGLIQLTRYEGELTEAEIDLVSPEREFTRRAAQRAQDLYKRLDLDSYAPGWMSYLLESMGQMFLGRQPMFREVEL